jgi:hypothetical protein
MDQPKSLISLGSDIKAARIDQKDKMLVLNLPNNTNITITFKRCSTITDSGIVELRDGQISDISLSEALNPEQSI